jgi:C1A family cysteine protease
MFDLVPRNKKYGWIPDLPDQRDFPYVRLAAAIPLLPKKIDLRSFCSPVENQGNIGSCTACSLVGNLEYLKKRRLKKIMDFSRLFLYYNERVLRNTTKTDSGASIRDGIKTLVKLGDCLEKLWPYNVKHFAEKPTIITYQNALNYQIKSYYRIKSIEEMKQTLSTGFPFVFGFAVYKSFESKTVTQTGNVPMPRIGERLLGGHAVMAVGFDDSKNTFIVKNSWSEKWGDHGYFYMPYQYLSNPRLSSDFWTIRDME